jgi:hypothetical protein
MGIAKLDTAGHWGIGVAGTNSLTAHIYIPQKSKIDHTNYAGPDTGRTADGVTHIDWIRTDVRRVHMEWDVMTGNEIAYMINLMQGKIYEFFYIEFGTVQHFTAYTGDCDFEKYIDNVSSRYSAEGGMYRSFSIDAVEM